MKKIHSIVILVILTTAVIVSVVVQPSRAFNYFDLEETPWDITFLYNHHSDEGRTVFSLYENKSMIRSWANNAHDLYHARLRWVKQVAEVGVSWALSIETDGYQGWCNGTYEVAPVIVYIIINQTIIEYVNVTKYVIIGNSTEVVFLNLTEYIVLNNTQVLIVNQTEYILVPEIVYVNQTTRETAMTAEMPNPLLFTGAGLISGLAIGVGYRKKDEHD